MSKPVVAFGSEMSEGYCFLRTISFFNEEIEKLERHLVDPMMGHLVSLNVK